MLQLSVLLFLTYLGHSYAEITLNQVGRVQLPVDIAEDGTEHYCWNVDLAEEVVYDSQNFIAYVGGEQIVTVVDIETPSEPKVLDRIDLGTPIADIQICDDIVAAIAYNNVSDALDGSLLIFSPYSGVTQSIELLQTLTICSEPDHLTFTPDCSYILIACSGKPGFDEEGNYFNPEGMVAVVDTSDVASIDQSAVKFADFTSFNKDAEQYVAAGVRYVYRGEVTPISVIEKDTFSKDLEPEYVAPSLDGKTGYVILQTNNAMAYLDIESAVITDIKSFGYKQWGEIGSTLDASDKDGTINMQPWMIRGLYTPDIIDVFEHDGVEYIVTANEGDAKELFPEDNGVTAEWTEEIVGQDLVDVVTNEDMKMALNDTTMLGRLAFSNVDGAPAGVDEYLYTYGGRSVSIWTAANLTLVWDSADILEMIHMQEYPDIFNMDASDEFCPIPENYPDYGATQEEIVAAILAEIEAGQDDPEYELPGEFEALVNGPMDGLDQRSDNKGPEPESVVVGMVGDKRMLFVGNERTSTIFVFDITDPTQPTLEGHIFDGAIEGTWWDLLMSGTVAPIDPEGLLFISAEQFPTNQPIVMVASAVTGALYIYEVVTM